MSLFTFRTSGLTRAQHDDIAKAFEYLATFSKKQGERIAALEAEVARLKTEPRMSLAQKLRSKK